MSAVSLPFSRRYAGYYDWIYATKDYPRECAYVVHQLRRFSTRGLEHILDVGCGTGGHAVGLARMRFRVTGVDRSDAMLRIARNRARTNGLDIDFAKQDMRSLDLGRTFDACIAMFAVVDYLTTEHDLLNTLRHIRHHLPAGAPFLFDFWFAPAVLAIKPSRRFLVLERDNERLIRLADPSFDPARRLCTTQYDCIVLRGRTVADAFQETHRVRFFFEGELRRVLKQARFGPVRFFAFLDDHRRPTSRTWNALCVARAA